MHKLIYPSIVLASLLTACTTSKSPQESIASTHPLTNMPLMTQKAQISMINNWSINGAIAAKGHKNGFTASIDWQQLGLNQYRIQLYGPLGNGNVVIEKKNGIITYHDNHKTIQAKHADELLYKETGVRLPVNHLYYWVRGIPAPGRVQEAIRDQNNHLTRLKQDGFTVEYLSYRDISGLTLPVKIRLHGKDLTIKLIIKQWSLQK